MTDEDDDLEDKTDSGSKKFLTDDEFAAAKELYELGKAHLVDIARDFGVSRQTLHRRFKAAGVVKSSRAHELNQTAATVQKATVERFAEKRAELIEETRMTGIQSLKQARLIAQKIIVEQVKRSPAGGPVNLGAVDDDMKAISRLNKLLVENITASLQILQADNHIDEEDLPILTIEDLTDHDILDHHKSTGALDADATLEDINLEINT